MTHEGRLSRPSSSWAAAATIVWSNRRPSTRARTSTATATTACRTSLGAPRTQSWSGRLAHLGSSGRAVFRRGPILDDRTCGVLTASRRSVGARGAGVSMSSQGPGWWQAYAAAGTRRAASVRSGCPRGSRGPHTTVGRARRMGRPSRRAPRRGGPHGPGTGTGLPSLRPADAGAVVPRPSPWRRVCRPPGLPARRPTAGVVLRRASARHPLAVPGPDGVCSSASASGCWLLGRDRVGGVVPGRRCVRGSPDGLGGRHRRLRPRGRRLLRRPDDVQLRARRGRLRRRGPL